MLQLMGETTYEKMDTGCKMILICISQMRLQKCDQHLCGSGYGAIVGTCEYGKAPLVP